jgi:hypothetical protein
MARSRTMIGIQAFVPTWYRHLGAGSASLQTTTRATVSPDLMRRAVADTARVAPLPLPVFAAAAVAIAVGLLL